MFVRPDGWGPLSCTAASLPRRSCPPAVQKKLSERLRREREYGVKGWMLESERQADRENNRTTEWQNDRMSQWQNDRMTEWQNDRMTEWQNDRMTEWRNDRQKERQKYRQRVSQTRRQIDRQTESYRDCNCNYLERTRRQTNKINLKDNYNTYRKIYTKKCIKK